MARNNMRYDTKLVQDESFWGRRTLLEKILLILCVLAGIAIVALATTLYVVKVWDNLTADQQPPQYRAEALRNARSTNLDDKTQRLSDKSNNEEDICLTKGCVKAAARIIEDMDETVDPCTNFYDFACGNFVKNTYIPDDKAMVDTFSIIRDKVSEQIERVLIEEPKQDEIRAFRLARKLHAACMNKTIIEERGNAPLLDLLNEYGGWPVVLGDQWIEAGWDWLDVIKRFRKAGLDFDMIFAFTITINLKNSTSRVIDLDQTSTDLGREFLTRGLNEKFVKAYYDLMVDYAVILGADQKRAEEELLEALNFETALSNISWAKEERRNASLLYNPMTIKELQEKYPYLPWLEYINGMLPDSIQVDENQLAINCVPSFFEKLGGVLQGVSKRTLANYFLWRIVSMTSGTLTNQLRKRKLKYIAVVSGQQDEQPRWKECADFTAGNLPMAVGALYIRRYYNQEDKHAANDLVANVRREFINILHGVTWMDEPTKNLALEKAKLITSHVGYPDELLDDKKVDEHYKLLELEPDNLFVNTLRLSQFNTNFFFGRLHKPVNKTDWVTHAKPAVVNAAYSPLENSIQFPAAVLQDKFFSVDHPHYLNYGAIGQIIGHEITHGFDDQGRQFDLHGNVAEWWQEETQQKFLEKAQCIIDQYSAFREPSTNLTLNGITTQGENIADNGGLKEAYNAYKKWAAKNRPEKRLPGLKYTPEQLFWISSAQTWCANFRPEYTKLRITSGVHSPNQYRVLGSITNTPDFSFDFNCPVGTKMNPSKKCEIW